MLFKILIIVLPAGLMVVVSNYFIDPANLFSSVEYVAGIADILSRGHNVDNIANYNERLLQEEMIKRRSQPAGIVVLGSSRIMEAGSDFFPGKDVLNCGVSHANIHDIIAITGLLDSMKQLPATVYINADIGLISEKGTTEWQSLQSYYKAFIDKYADGSSGRYISSSLWGKKLYSLVSFEYFRESLSFFLKGKQKKYTDAGTSIPSHYGRFSDGSISYSSAYRMPDTVKVAGDAVATAKQEGLSLPDTANMKRLNNLLDFYAGRKITVRLIMLPYHPAYYTTINSKQPGVFHRYESFYLKLAVDKNIEIYGGFDAAEHKVLAPEFYDMYHCSKQAVKRIFLNK